MIRTVPLMAPASMGPRLFSVDDSRKHTSGDLHNALQWGHACSAWMTSLPFSEYPSQFELQWGHACSAWMTAGGDSDHRMPQRLQWGHACSAWMTPDTA